jgi:hypothetical protein
MAISGGWLLYQNTAPDRPFGTIPRTNYAAPNAGKRIAGEGTRLDL